MGKRRSRPVGQYSLHLTHLNSRVSVRFVRLISPSNPPNTHTLEKSCITCSWYYLKSPFIIHHQLVCTVLSYSPYRIPVQQLSTFTSNPLFRRQKKDTMARYIDPSAAQVEAQHQTKQSTDPPKSHKSKKLNKKNILI